VPPDDAGALAGALGRLASDRAMRTRLADEGRRLFAERFAAEPFAASVGAAYRGLGFAPE
jgi:hypothetical protein